MQLARLMELQKLFEENLVGTDGSLYDANTPQFSLERGIIGEGYEAIEALTLFGIASDEFRNELVDIYVFFASLLVKVGMTEEELEERSRRIVVKNFIKYRPEYFEDSTVREAMQKARDNWGGNHA